MTEGVSERRQARSVDRPRTDGAATTSHVAWVQR
jgi:hypothetical protein